MQPLLTDEKTGLMYRVWQTDAPKASFVLVHGLGAHSARWEAMADYFTGRDYSVYAIELRGFGETLTRKGHINSFREYYKDLRRLHEIAKLENPRRKIFLLGESLGGLISFEMAVRYGDLYDGTVCVSPAFGNRMDLSVMEYVLMGFSFLFLPRMRFKMPFKGDMCTRDSERVKALDTDPREHRVASARLLYETLKSQIRSTSSKKKIAEPILFLLSGNDKLVNPEVSEQIFQKLITEDKTIIRYPEMYHSLTIDLGKEKMFEDVVNWAKERIV